MDQLFRLHFLFDKYLRRQCTKAEVEELIALLQQGDESLIEPMEQLWYRLKEDKTTFPVDWDKIYHTMVHSEENLAMLNQNKNSKSWKLWFGMAAIIIAFTIGLAIFFRETNHPSLDTKNLVALEKDSMNRKKLMNRQTIHLPDGSTVILNADSKLNYPPVFSLVNREVYLTGEGYFDVKHNPRQPFFVHAGKIVTKVLGTAFDIKAYPMDESIEITVTRGKVQVLKENKSLGLVSANQQISFSKKTEQYARKMVDTKFIVAWKPLEIVFNDITMEEAAKRIERRFSTEVKFGNPAVKNCRVTATFSEDDMLEEILTIICGVSKASYSIQNNKIMIDGKGCNE